MDENHSNRINSYLQMLSFVIPLTSLFPATFLHLSVTSEDLDCHRHILWYLFFLNDLYVSCGGIGEIVDHHCLGVLFIIRISDVMVSVLASP